MKETKKKISFIVTKPLQLIVALAILDQFHTDENIEIFICDNFNNAEAVQRKLAKLEDCKYITHFCENRKLALQKISESNSDEIYIDSDVGLQIGLDLLKFKIKKIKCKINVYEEGSGTYEIDRYKGLRAKIFKALGLGTIFGSCILTNSIYLYNVKEYVENFPKYSKKCKRINLSIWDLINVKEDIIEEIFGKFNISNRVRGYSLCRIYLTSHTLDDKCIENFKKIIGLKYIKLHPHIKNEIKIDGFEVLPAHQPVEIIIKNLLKYHDKIIIYGHESSCRRYIQDVNVEYVTNFELLEI